ncbi:MAG: tetratricopeptide repeat protein [Bacteroidota bacterium]|nr:tetratricopeptide repeat protein [Bacteroidota bacterium]
MARKESGILIFLLILVFGISGGKAYPQNADSLLNILHQQAKKEKIIIFLQLAELSKADHPMQAEAYLDTALLMAKQYNYDSLISAAAYKKGAAALGQGMIREAREYLQTSYLHYHRENDERGYGNLLDLLGETYARLGRLDTAYAILQSSLDLKLGMKDTAAIARVYIKIGNVNYLNGNLERAHASYRKATDYFRLLQDKHGIATASMNLGNVYEELGKPDSAKYFYYTALQLNEKLGDYKDISILLNNLGVFHLNQGNNDSAIYYLTKSSEAAGKINDHYQIAVLKNNIGLIHDKNKEFRKAQETYLEALRLAKANHYLQLERSIYQNLAANYANTGDFKKAYETHSKYAALNDSINDLETKERISSLQFEFEKKGRSKRSGQRVT